MSTQSDIAALRAIIASLDSNRIAKFSYTDTAFASNIVDGVESFSVSAEQNVPLATKTDFNDKVLTKGVRTQGASIARMAVNHFFGRTSYNVNKLVQKFLAWIDIDKVSKAHNANEYDTSAPYAPGDTCYLIGSNAGIYTYTLFERISVSPSTITGIAPTNTAHWKEVLRKSGGEHKRYTIADLTSPTYDVDTWYPVVTTLQDFEAGMELAKDAVTRVVVEAYCNGTITGYANAHRAELSVQAKLTGFATSSTDVVKDYSCVDQVSGDDHIGGIPIGYSKLPLGRQVVLWLRGGSKYGLWNSFGSSFTLHTSSYDNGLDASISPSATNVFNVLNAQIRADIKGTLDGNVVDARLQFETESLGFTFVSTDMYLSIKNNKARSMPIGTVFSSGIELTPVPYAEAKSSAHPEYPDYEPIIPLHDADHDISTDQVPQQVIDTLNEHKFSFLGQADFTGTVSSGAITLPAGAEEDALLAYLVEQAAVARFFASGESATYAALGGLFTGSRQLCGTISDTQYAISGANIALRTIDFAVAPPNGSQILSIHPHRIAGYTNKSRLRRVSGQAMIAAGDASGKYAIGGSSMDSYQGVSYAITGGWNTQGGGAAPLYIVGKDSPSLGNVTFTGMVLVPITDGVNGTPRPKKNTSNRGQHVGVYMHVGVLLDTDWTSS